MSKRNQTEASLPTRPPSRIVWTDERLAALGPEHLRNLLENLQVQRVSGGITEDAALDLEDRIQALLVHKGGAIRRKRPHSAVILERTAAGKLANLAVALEQAYELVPDNASTSPADGEPLAASASEGTTPAVQRRPRRMTDAKGLARAGASTRDGSAQIERFISWRADDSFATLVFVLLIDDQEKKGRFVLIATDDLLPGDDQPNDYSVLATRYGWSVASRARMRARPMSDYRQAAAEYEALIARMVNSANLAVTQGEA